MLVKDEIGLEIALRTYRDVQVTRKGTPVTAEDVRALTVDELAKCDVIVKSAPIEFGDFSHDGTLTNYEWRTVRTNISGIGKKTPAFEFLELVCHLASLYDLNFGWES